MDETLVTRSFEVYYKYPFHRWVFGFYCTTTKIPIMYYVTNRKIKYLHPLIKKHILPGTVLFSDEHSSYVNMHSNISHLTKYGIYHYWVVHSHTYTHEEFCFINSSIMESMWNRLKR